MHLQFLGATQTVTGSKYLIKADKSKILVDCGLFQGFKDLRLRNWNPLPLHPKEIDYVLLTHAHLDHSGYIPLLVKNGFRGKIFCTEATRDLCAILLPDSGHLQEEEAFYANRKGSSKHRPALPLYTKQEAEIALEYFQPVPYEKSLKLSENLHCSFHYAGHILGASLIRVQHHNSSVLFSGDLGRPHDPIMYDPSKPPESNYYVIESTYGNRLHEKTNPEEQLGEIIKQTAKKGGVTIIPSFAVGRAQSILYYLHQLRLKNVIPNIPIFVDSPMATDATKLFYHYSDQHKLTKEQTASVCQSATYIHTVEESKELHRQKMPMIIISASGMATGGRILHHIKHFAPDHRNSLVFCGFQAGGTRGDRIIRGETHVKMFGELIPIRASVFQLDNTSAHADYEDMLKWLSHIKKPPRKLFITHGENTASEALKEKIQARYHWNCEVPSYLDNVELI